MLSHRFSAPSRGVCTPSRAGVTLLLSMLLAGLSACGGTEPAPATDNGKKPVDDSDAKDDEAGDDDVATEGKQPTNNVKKPTTTTTRTNTSDAGPAPDPSCASIRQDAPAERGSVDVVWLVDTSGSMWDDFAQIQRNLAGFTQELEQSSNDIHVVMLTGTDPAIGTQLGSDPQRYRFVPTPVDSRMLYATALFNFASYQDFLRPGAATHFVMVTDDQDFLTAAEFRAEMEKTLGHSFTLHAIASEDVGGRPCANATCGGVWVPLVCGAVSIGEAYNTLADLTGGGKISICTEDWTNVFARLSKAVIAAVPLPCEYPLKRVSTKTFDPTKVQVVYTPEGAGDEEFPKAGDEAKCEDARGWYFDDANKPTNVVLCPAACEQVQQGGSIDIAFGCKPSQVI